jgi:GntR family transcriptional regulator
VTATLKGGGSFAVLGPLGRDLRRWVSLARKAGLDEESIEALLMSTFRDSAREDIA